MTVLRQPAVAITFGRSREALEPFFLMLKSAPWSHATWFASFTSAGAAGKSVAQIGAGKAGSRSEWTSPSRPRSNLSLRPWRAAGGRIFLTVIFTGLRASSATAIQ